MMDEHAIKEALAARSEAPSDAFRRAITSALAHGRPRRTAQPWMAAAAVVLLLVLPVTILLGSRAALHRSSTHPPQPATSARTAPPASDTLPVRVAMAADGHGWAVLGGPGFPQDLAVATTADAGAHWQPVLAVGTGQVPYLTALDAQRAVFVWTESFTSKFAPPPKTAKVFSTIDGGAHWRSYPLPMMPDQQDEQELFSFISADDGWWLTPFTSGPAPTRSVMHTVDAGKSWERITDGTGAVSVSFIDSRTGFLGLNLNTPGRPPEMRRTTDGGRTWKNIELPAPRPEAGYPGLSATTEVRRAAGSMLVANLATSVGSQGVGAPMSLVLYSSWDNGATWGIRNLAWSGQSAVTGIPIFTTTSGDAWFIAVGRQILRSSDQGMTWVPQSLALPAPYEATQLVFGPPSQGMLLMEPVGGCTGCPPVLFRTTDAGRTWTKSSDLSSPTTVAEPRVSLGTGPYQGDPGSPAVLLKLGSDPRLRAVSWDLSQSGLTGASGTSIIQSADGRYYFDGGQIYDRTGNQLAPFPWTTKGFGATWSTGDQLCRASGSPEVTGSPLVLQVAAIGKPLRTVASGFGTYGDNASYPVLACDETSGVAVVAAFGQGFVPGRAWVIQLSSGRLTRTFDYFAGGAQGLSSLQASSDGTLLAESARSTSGSWTTTIRRTSDGGVVEVIDNLDVRAFSGDSKLLAGVRGSSPVVIERGTHREVWSAPAKGWYGAFPEPKGESFLIGTSSDPSSQQYDLYLVAPNRPAALLPEGAAATLAY